MTREEWDAETPENQYKWAKALDELTMSYERVVREVPECPDHGSTCVPHAIEWIKEAVMNTRKNERTDFEGNS